MTVPGVHRRRFRRAPAEKRARIIAVARACLSERAYAEVTTAEIAQRAGVSEGTVFHHFGTKRGLMVAVAEDYARDMAQATFRGVEMFAPPAIEACFRRGLAFLQKEGSLGLQTPSSTSTEATEIVREAVREALISEAERVLDAWQERKLIRRMSSRLFGETMFPVFDQLLMKALIEGTDAISDAWLREVTACFAGALSSTPLPRQEPQPARHRLPGSARRTPARER